jgi:hypothetical protein
MQRIYAYIECNIPDSAKVHGCRYFDVVSRYDKHANFFLVEKKFYTLSSELYVLNINAYWNGTTLIGSNMNPI